MKTTLIIDGNYLLNKDVFVLYNIKSLHSDLLNLLKLDLDKLLKLYNFDKVYFVSDSKKGYWRKHFYIDYKAKRETNDNIDWKWVYDEFNTFKEELNNNPKIEQINIDYAEGDDIIAYLINKNNKLGYSNLVIASDGDLHQLLKFDINEDYFNFMYNYKFSDERLYLPNNYNVYLYEKKRNANNLLFDMNQDDEYIEFIEGLIERTKVTTVSPEETLFLKCVHGDKGDNITSAYEKIGKTGKTMGIGLDGAKTIYRLYKETYNNEEIDFDSEVFIDKCAELISFSKKIEDENALDVIKKKLKRNRKLTKLTENYLPDYLLNEFNKINIK